uniref:Uncharacterized protein n=1 Tax=Panagrolaimus sp. JU765 TaxID=591449 RepID=A0AC34R8N0_9BILA
MDAHEQEKLSLNNRSFERSLSVDHVEELSSDNQTLSLSNWNSKEFVLQSEINPDNPLKIKISHKRKQTLSVDNIVARKKKKQVIRQDNYVEANTSEHVLTNMMSFNDFCRQKHLGKNAKSQRLYNIFLQANRVDESSCEQGSNNELSTRSVGNNCLNQAVQRLKTYENFCQENNFENNGKTQELYIKYIENNDQPVFSNRINFRQFSERRHLSRDANNRRYFFTDSQDSERQIEFRINNQERFRSYRKALPDSAREQRLQEDKNRKTNAKQNRNKRQLRARTKILTNNQRVCRQFGNFKASIAEGVEPFSCGPMDFECEACHALHYRSEKALVGIDGQVNTFSSCCANGKVLIDMNVECPDFLRDYLTGNDAKSSMFRKIIMKLNTLLSFGYHFKRFPSLPGVYNYRVQGEFKQVLPRYLTPKDGEKPAFGQMYILETEECLNLINSNINFSDDEKKMVIDFHNFVKENNLFVQRSLSYPKI